MAQRIPLPLTVSCFSKIQIGFTFLVPAYPGSPGQRAIKRVCVCYLGGGCVHPPPLLRACPHKHGETPGSEKLACTNA